MVEHIIKNNDKATSKWKECILGDVINLKRGYDLPKKKRVFGEYPIVASNGVTDYHNEYKVEGPGVATGRSGTLGNITYSKKNYWPLNTALYVQDFKGNNIEFIYYFLKTMNFQNYNAGSGVPTLNRNHVHSLNVKIPPLHEQKKIASILKSLDDKIEVNNQMNQTLEEMAQNIFKEWFVEFNFPNEDGVPYKDNGGEMVESELGMIPKGWRVGTIDKIADVVAGGTPSKKIDEYFAKEKEIPWITPKDLSGYTGKFIKRGTLDITELGLQKSSAKLMPKGTVLFSSRAPIGYIAIARNNVTTNQGFKSLVPNKGLGTEYLYYMLHNIKEDIKNNASGSTFKEVSGAGMKKHELIIPSIQLTDLFEKTVSKLSDMILKNEVEIDILTKSRDILLPKLINGEIRV